MTDVFVLGPIKFRNRPCFIKNCEINLAWRCLLVSEIPKWSVSNCSRCNLPQRALPLSASWSWNCQVCDDAMPLSFQHIFYQVNMDIHQLGSHFTSREEYHHYGTRTGFRGTTLKTRKALGEHWPLPSSTHVIKYLYDISNTRIHNLIVCFMIEAPWPLFFGQSSKSLWNLEHQQNVIISSLVLKISFIIIIHHFSIKQMTSNCGRGLKKTK